MNLFRESGLNYQIQFNFKQFIKTHFVIPVTLFLVVFIGLEFTSLDYQISENFYNVSLHQWAFRNNWLAEGVLHKGGQAFSEIMGVIVFLVLLFSLPARSSLHRYWKPLVFLFLASITGPIIVAILKNNTHIYCPWDLKVFGGTKPYIHFFDYAPAYMKAGHCFPSGHAGGGFTFVGLYFFLVLVVPQYKYWGLCAGLLLGLVFGVAQQMRGAHFLSHDVFSLAVCWLASLSWFLLIFRKKLQWV
jgi:membrane-associated PAP2 superfamily phosphatase